MIPKEKTKEEILIEMAEVMPFVFPESIQPYILEAMDIYVKSIAIEFAEWCGSRYSKLHGCWVLFFADQNNDKNRLKTSELFAKFMAERSEQ